MANPGQDGDIENDPTQNPEHEIAQAVEQREAEVEEIQAIEEEGGFDAVTDISEEPSVHDPEGMAGVRDVDEAQVQRKRMGEQDLEAQVAATSYLDGLRRARKKSHDNETGQ
jgi:hypothetical protein